MTLRRGLLFGCTAATLFAQEIHVEVDQAAIQRSVEKVMEVQHEMLAKQEHMMADASIAMKKAWNVNLDHAGLAMQMKFFQYDKGGTPLTDDEQMKIMAIDSIMQNDTERAIPLVEKVVQNQQASIRLRLRALQALANSNSTKAREIVMRVAKDGSNPELQSRALQLLGSREGSQNTPFLREVYGSTNSNDVKRQVLRSWANSGAKDQIVNVAKSDASPEVREQAIRHLGEMRANAELGALYASESSTELRERILRSLAQADDWQKLIDIAKTEKNEQLRNRAIRQVGSSNALGASEALVTMYNSSLDASTRSEIQRALSQQRNAKQLIAVARKETDPELKRAALQHLTRMKGDDVTAYLTELLQK